jgi:uncharacterized membrane protein
MQNVGSLDRIIRAVLGIALIIAPLLLSASLFAAPWAFWLSIAVGVVLLGTAALSFCPIYAALGLRTRHRT